MSFIESLKMAVESIKANKLRSFLTMLGIIIGISSVITIVSLGKGGQKAIAGEFEKIGALSINIKVDPVKAHQRDYITLEDIRQLRSKIDTIKYITPMVQKRGYAISEDKNRIAFITGGNTDLPYIDNTEVIYGRYFNEREYVEGKPVVVLDENSAKAVFGYSDAVGKSLKIGSRSSALKASVIGVTKGFINPFGETVDPNMPIFVCTPVTFLRTLYPTDFGIDSVMLVATSQNAGEAAGNGAKNMLENRHNNMGKDIYKAENMMKQLDQVNRIFNIFTTFIGAVAAISLIVGGIGVMNIMLISVTERTREIGIRKAIGATTSAIMIQFLSEAVIISLMGGIIGMFVGIAGAEAIGMFAKISPTLSLRVVIEVILFSSAVGVTFGIYPAQKAAKLDPIDALRYE